MRVNILVSEWHIIGFVSKLPLRYISIGRLRWDNIEFIPIKQRRPPMINPGPITIYNLHERYPCAYKNFKVIFCADDTNLTGQIDYFSSLLSTKEDGIEDISPNTNMELDYIQEWLSTNKLLNVKKNTRSFITVNAILVISPRILLLTFTGKRFSRVLLLTPLAVSILYKTNDIHVHVCYDYIMNTRAASYFVRHYQLSAPKQNACIYINVIVVRCCAYIFYINTLYSTRLQKRYAGVEQ